MLGKKYKILSVEDDLSMQSYFQTVLGKEFGLITASSIAEAQKIAAQEDFQIVLLDIGLPDGNGLSLLKYIKDLNEDIEVIVVTMNQNVKSAIEAIRQGAFDYIDKNFDPADLLNHVRNALQKYLKQRKIVTLESQLEQVISEDFVVGSAPKMQKIYSVVEKTALVPANVLITGESGTGKEIIARRIHHLSSNNNAPFIAVNVASVPADLIESTLFGHERGSFTGAHRLHYGKFELADTGTLFLDEIGELRIDLQAKLLRAIQEQVIERVGGNRPIPINVRIIAATNANLEAKIRSGLFREDLFYRLNVVPIHLPPLRERLEDIPQYIRFFINKYNLKFSRNVVDVTESVLNILQAYSWPGNIRELENLIERILALTEKTIISEADIPVEYLVSDFDNLKKMSPDGDVLTQATEAFERNFILRVLEQAEWIQNKASSRLGIHRKTLEYKIKKYQLAAIISKKRPG